MTDGAGPFLGGKKRIRIPPAERVIRTHEGARLEKVGRLNVLRLKGSDYQMGLAHGTLLREEIASGFYEYYTGCISRLVEASARSGSDSFVAYFRSIVRKRLFANWIYNRLLRTAPRAVKEELQGISDGSHLPLDKMLRAFVVPDVFLYLVGLLFRTRRRILSRGLMPACSSLLAWGSATTDGGMLHARNLEFFGIGHWDAHPTVLFCEPEQGIPYVSVTTAGVGTGGITAMNAAGLTLALNVHVTRDIAAEGTPMIWIGNDVIRRAESIADAVRIAAEHRPACGFSLTIGDARRPGAAVIEFSAGKQRVRYATEPTLVMTNHYLNPEMRRDELEINTSVRLHSHGRYLRGSELLHDHGGRIGVAEMAEFLGDHVDPFMHRVRAAGTILTQPHNITSVVFAPREQTLWVASGSAPVSHGPFVGLSMKDPTPTLGRAVAAPAEFGTRPPAPAAHEESAPVEVSHPYVEGNPYAGTAEFSAYQHYMKAYTAQLDGEPLDEILDQLTQAARADDQEPVYALMLGLFLLTAKRYPEAEAALERAATLPDLEHKQATARYWKAIACQLQGNTVAAQNELLLVLANHGAGEELRQAAKDRWSRPFAESELAHLEIDMVYTDVIG
ncbi:MAG: hypothetical protein HZA54_00490 [Planctomycetes bacterium]|nr:hypothetical protein [Planctomycetota bacterium]